MSTLGVEQFPSRTSNSFFLKGIFFLKSDKVFRITTNKQTKQQTTFFSAKINKVFLSPILQNLKGRSVLDKFFFENDPLDKPKKMPLSEKFYLFRKVVKNAKW